MFYDDDLSKKARREKQNAKRVFNRMLGGREDDLKHANKIIESHFENMLTAMEIAELDEFTASFSLTKVALNLLYGSILANFIRERPSGDIPFVESQKTFMTILMLAGEVAVSNMDDGLLSDPSIKERIIKGAMQC